MTNWLRKRAATQSLTVASGIDTEAHELVDEEPISIDGDREISDYRCAQCGYLILINMGENIDAACDLVDWLYKNCPQDEEAAKPATGR